MINKNTRFFYALIVGVVILCFSCVMNCFANPLDEWKDTKAYKPKPVLFVHGFNSNSKIWEPTIEELSKYFSKYQIIGPYLETIDFQDNIGSIDSYPDGEAGCVDNLRDKIENLLDKTKYGSYNTKLNLVCHSMGGLAAREFITNPKYPSAYVDKLILIGVPNLGSPLAPAAKDMIKFYSIGSMAKPELFLISCNARNSIDSFAEIVWIPDIDASEAIKDMFPGSNFLNILNDRAQPADTQYYGIYGIIGHIFNLFFFKDFYGGDGIVNKDSQLGMGHVIFKEDPQKIKAFHNSEPALSVSGDNPLLKFLDSTTPEFTITYPDPNQTTDIYIPSINIQGKVYKEYLPADTKLIINVTREDDGQTLPEQSSLLKASDLWQANNPDSPVAEFDEPINLPGKGTYKISCQLKNPAGLTSDIKDVWVKVITGVTGIIVHCHNPEGKEINSISGVKYIDSVQILDGSEFIGYSANNIETHGIPLELAPGTHTIKAVFNGITKEQTIALNPEETKVITFIFERISKDYKEFWHLSPTGSFSGSGSGEGSVGGGAAKTVWSIGDQQMGGQQSAHGGSGCSIFYNISGSLSVTIEEHSIRVTAEQSGVCRGGCAYTGGIKDLPTCPCGGGFYTQVVSWGRPTEFINIPDPKPLGFNSWYRQITDPEGYYGKTVTIGETHKTKDINCSTKACSTYPGDTICHPEVETILSSVPYDLFGNAI